MSPAETAVRQTQEPVTTGRPRPVSTRFLRSELLLIFGRRRNWAGLAVLASVPIIIAVAVRLSSPGEGGDDGARPRCGARRDRT